MSIKIKLIGFSLLLVSACSSSRHNISFHDTDFIKDQKHISLEFNGHEDFWFEIKTCEALWDSTSQFVYLSGLLIENDSLGTTEQITISIEGIDLTAIDFPYRITTSNKEEAIVGWYNEKEIARTEQLCDGVDKDCEYRGSSSREKINLVLTGFSNGVLEGFFQGRIYLKGTGKLRFVKTSDYKDISKGSFRLDLKKYEKGMEDVMAVKR